MDNNDKDAICRVVRDNIGIRMAMAVYAALKVAEQRWSEQDIQNYGTMISSIITEKR